MIRGYIMKNSIFTFAITFITLSYLVLACQIDVKTPVKEKISAQDAKAGIIAFLIDYGNTIIETSEDFQVSIESFTKTTVNNEISISFNLVLRKRDKLMGDEIKRQKFETNFKSDDLEKQINVLKTQYPDAYARIIKHRRYTKDKSLLLEAMVIGKNSMPVIKKLAEDSQFNCFQTK